jgi:hypothetical protein
MSRSPLKSKWAEYFVKIHHGILLRRSILKELYNNSLEKEILVPMFKHYISCLLSSIMIYYITRKESFSIKFVLSAGSFGLSILYIQLYYEENLFYFKGLQDTKAGKIIRDKYIELHPDFWAIAAFKSKEEDCKNFYNKYHHRDSPMEKFNM